MDPQGPGGFLIALVYLNTKSLLKWYSSKPLIERLALLKSKLFPPVPRPQHLLYKNLAKLPAMLPHLCPCRGGLGEDVPIPCCGNRTFVLKDAAAFLFKSLY